MKIRAQRKYKINDLAEAAEELKKITITEQGCHEYHGKKTNLNYSRIRFRGRDESAHRISWAIANGGMENLKEGFHICHKCNNPPCINPEHLYQGTPSENAIDAVKAGHKRIKFTENDILYIRDNYIPGDQRRTAELMIKYDISQSYLYQIATGRIWKFVK